MHKDVSLRIHISLYFTVTVVFGANRMRNTMYHSKCIQTTVKLPARVQVLEPLAAEVCYSEKSEW